MRHRQGFSRRGWPWMGMAGVFTLCLTLASPSPGAAEGAIPIYQAETIGAPGVYYLTQDNTTGAGITIDADNVTLDLNGHTLVSTAHGVYSTRDRIRVTNGFISAGWQGVALSPATSTLLQVDRITVTRSGSTAISLTSGGPPPQVIVEDNSVLKVDDGTGIYVSNALNSRISRNTIKGATRIVSGGYGIHLVNFKAGVVSDNAISSSSLAGLFAEGSDWNQIVRNKSSFNSGDGIVVAGPCTGNSVAWNVAGGNGAGGIAVGGTDNVVAYNHAGYNGTGGVGFPTTCIDGGGNYPHP